MEPARQTSHETRTPPTVHGGPPRAPHRTMRAAVLAAPGRVEFREVPRPVPDTGEVLVRLEGCGVCASNVPVWEGREWFQYPLPPGAPGHEGWGVVDAVGPEVSAVVPGDRVALLSDCAFAEYDVAPADAVVRLPASLNEWPLPGEPLGCAMNILTRSAVRPGQTVAVVGAGFLGTLLLSLAREAGARVIAVSHRASSRETARRMGAEESLPMANGHTAVERIGALTGGRGCERVIETTGLQAPLDLAAELVAVRGRLVIAGFHQDGPRRVDMQSWNWRGIDVVNAHERDTATYADGIRRALDAIQRNRFDPFPLLTHRFAFANLADAMDTALRRPEGFIKGWVQMGG